MYLIRSAFFCFDAASHEDEVVVSNSPVSFFPNLTRELLTYCRHPPTQTI